MCKLEMAYFDLDQYNNIMKILKPVFVVFTILFFTKEFSLLFSLELVVDRIPDLVFFVVILTYAIFYISPMFKPELVDGYELPEIEEDEEEEEEELTEEEKELKELERISL